MAKWLTLLVLVAVFGRRQDAPKKQQAPASTATGKADQARQPVPAFKPVIDPPITASQDQPAAPQKHQEAKPETNRWFLRPEWVIVWVTIVYTIFTGFTLRAIKRQADLMEGQAQDARRAVAENATATNATLKAVQDQTRELSRQNGYLFAKERAHLSISTVLSPEIIKNVIIKDVVVANRIKVTLHIVNSGNSAALNVRGFGMIVIGDFEEVGGMPVIDNETIDPEDWSPLDTSRILFPTGGGPPHPVLVSELGGLVPTSMLMMNDSDLAKIRITKRPLLISGELFYDDIFSKEHRTPFLFAWINLGDYGDQGWRENASWLDLSGDSS